MGKRKKEAQAAAQRRFDPNLYSSEEEMKMAARTHQRHRQDPDDSDAAEEIKRIKFEVETDQGARRVRGERERGPGYGYGYGRPVIPGNKWVVSLRLGAACSEGDTFLT